MSRIYSLSSYALLIIVPVYLFGSRCFCIRQKNIPYVIEKSGKYLLCENITYDGPGSAITINADDVKLELGSYSIVLSDANATGILVDGVSEFSIESDVIKNSSTGVQNGFGIHVINADNGTIDHVFTLNHFDGLFIESSANVHVRNSQFANASNAGALVSGSSDVLFDACTFDANARGLVLSDKNRDCMIANSLFPSATFSNLNAQQIDGLIIENCLFTNIDGDPAKLNLVQFGDAAPEQVCNDVIMRNCTMVNRPAHTPALGNTAPEGLGIYQGSGFLIEACVIDIDNTNQDPAADLSCIHISNPGLGNGTTASNVIIRDCIVQGMPTNGLYPDVGTTGVLIEGCLASGALKNGIFLAGTSASVVQNNTVVNNATNGIFIGETSFSNAVNGNIVTTNGFNPIITSLSPFGNGISIASDSTNNTVQHNEVFKNTTNGIDDRGTGNRIYYNTAYGNVTNYNATVDTIIVSNPGDPARSAENITQ